MSSLNTFSRDLIKALDNVDKTTIAIFPSKLQTKEWRKKQDWYNTGKSNECEKYQRKLVENITMHVCPKSCKRLNMYTFELKDVTSPLKHDNGFEWTEDFDGFQDFHRKNIYFNFKMVCDAGGAQTRTLREVYHFIHTQLEFLLKHDIPNTYFVNILDGDECHKHAHKFSHLKNNKKYKHLQSYMFIGDMYAFKHWWSEFSKGVLQYDKEDRN